MRIKKFIPCRKCKSCGKPLNKPKANKSGLCSACYLRRPRK